MNITVLRNLMLSESFRINSKVPSNKQFNWGGLQGYTNAEFGTGFRYPQELDWKNLLLKTCHVLFTGPKG